MIHNVHQRDFPVSPATIGGLIDRVTGTDSPLWPVDAWPEVLFDRPLSVGATGGHADIRYTCTAYEPGNRAEFSFIPGPLRGTHTLEVLDGPNPDSCVLRHIISARPHGIGHLAWPLAVRWLHDALLEDLLDRAGDSVGHPPERRAKWSPWVRIMHAAARKRARTTV